MSDKIKSLGYRTTAEGREYNKQLFGNGHPKNIILGNEHPKNTLYGDAVPVRKIK